jgi:hypothetical protein
MADDLDELRGTLARAKASRGTADDPRVTELREQIREITKLAHTGNWRDEREYRERQGELQSLMVRLVQAQQQGDQPRAIGLQETPGLGYRARVRCRRCAQS